MIQVDTLAGDALVYSTYLGGSDSDIGWGGIAVDTFGNAYVAGSTLSTDFPTASFQNTNAGLADAYVAKITPTLIGPYSLFEPGRQPLLCIDSGRGNLP